MTSTVTPPPRTRRWTRAEYERPVALGVFQPMFTRRVAPETHGAYVIYAQRVCALRDTGYQQFAPCLVPGHKSALGDWARVVETI